jgi:hypothetical protein
MTSWTKLVAVLVLVGFAGASLAAPADKPAKEVDKTAKQAEKAAKAGADKVAKPKALKGKLVKIDGSNLVLSVGKKNEQAREVTIATDANTKVVIGGKEAKLADIPAGATIGVLPETGVAQQIIVSTPKPKNKDKAAAAAADAPVQKPAK